MVFVSELSACSTTDDHRDLTAVTILKITDVQSEDLQRNFTCSVKNARGSMARWVQLEEEGEEDSGLNPS